MKNLKSLLKVIKFAWGYSVKVGGKRIWLHLFYKVYKNLYPIVNAFFVKLAIDTLTKVGQLEPEIIIRNILLIFTAHFLFESWDNFGFRHGLVISRTLQKLLISGIDIDIAYKNASLPITTIESSEYKDKYTLVKRESGIRIFPMVDNSVSLIANLITIIVSAGVIVGFGPIYIPILIFVHLPTIFTIKPALKKNTQYVSESAKISRYGDIYLKYLESLKGAYEARILGIKNYVRKKLASLLGRTIGLFEKTQMSLLLPRTIAAIAPSFGVFTVSFSMAQKVANGLVSIGDWQFVTNASFRFTTQVKEIIGYIGELVEGSVFAGELIDVLNLPEHETKGKKADIAKIKTLEFDNVSFRYANAKRFALKNVSFKVEGNQDVAIVGHNGAGKTTLVKLICRFYRPTEGTIKINGIDIWDYDLESYWKLISALYQDFETFGMSARESIGYGDVARINNESRIRKVASLSGINKYLSGLSKGYDTPLIQDFEGGVGLSTGQWQKVAIARALFRKSKILILDEPTSNLDPESEEEIFNKLIRVVKKRTMFLISHRFSTVKRAEKIIVIEKGQLVEEGSHQELMAQKGLYAKLFKIQSESYRE